MDYSKNLRSFSFDLYASMTRDVDDFPRSLDEHLKDSTHIPLNSIQAPYSVVEDDDIFFAATLLLSISNFASLNSERISNAGKKAPVRSCTLLPKNVDFMIDEDLPSKTCKKRRSTSHISKSSDFMDRICAYCKCTETPMWRHGPPGFQNLCNKVHHNVLKVVRGEMDARKVGVVKNHLEIHLNFFIYFIICNFMVI